MIEVIFDIETKNFFDDFDTNDPKNLETSIVSAYRRELNENFQEIKGEMKSFWEKDFPAMWPWFEEADRIIGYNSLGFDVPVMAKYYPRDFAKLRHFDLLPIIKEKFGHRIKLDSIAKETLGTAKIAAGGDAVEYWRKGDPESLEKLRKYCEMDVWITRDVYDYGLKNKKLRFKDHWNELREIEVDFSYPVNHEPVMPQLGLF